MESDHSCLDLSKNSVLFHSSEGNDINNAFNDLEKIILKGSSSVRVMAIAESRGIASEIGYAFMDLERPECYIAQVLMSLSLFY